MLVLGARRFAGLTIPPLKHFGPLLFVFAAAMSELFLIRDLGSSVMFYGAFLSLLYVATGRFSFVLVGLALFAFGAWEVGTHVPHVHDRIEAWLHPFRPELYNRTAGGSYQIVQSMFAQADGGVPGAGFGQAFVNILPAAQNDLIYAVIVNELGLAGACGLLLVYLLAAERGFRIAILARDSFSKLLATGLTAVFALQVFVIVGGVTRVIPLTGVTLPFVSYGGSSIVANFVLLALLLCVSDRARREPALHMNEPISRLFGLVVVLFALLVAWTSRWTVFDAAALRANPLNKRSTLEEQRIPRGRILAADGTVLAYSTKRDHRPAARAPTPATTRRTACSPTPSATTTPTSAAPASSSSTTARSPTATTGLRTVLDQLLGRRRVGQDLYTNLDPAAQRVAYQALGDHDRRGRRAGAAHGGGAGDGLDPDLQPVDGRHPGRLQPPQPRPRLAPLVNRATQFGTAPGSTFKTVTSTAALDTRQVHAALPGQRPQRRRHLRQAAVQRLQRELRRPRPRDGADEVGQHRLRPGRGRGRQADDEALHGALRVRQQAASSTTRATRCRPAASTATTRCLPPTSTYADVGRMGIGQDKLAVTPLQMALVASAIANQGVLMQPRLGARIVDRDGRTVEDDPAAGPEAGDDAPQTAKDITTMMVSVVQRGTGTKASIPGIQVAGKTGTAETQIGTTRSTTCGSSPSPPPTIRGSRSPC